MKAVKGNVFAVEIKGRVLHTGQPRYIKRVAKAKYNTLLDI